ncbi:MAG: response regulator transcription factor [Caldilineaceae bacterium]|nr:response regulator transcription factor [Caldilineaceae bacterium]
MATVRLLIVEDHDFFRQTIRLLLEADERITVVGVAASSAEAIALTESLRPDVVLLDLNLASGSGLAVTQKISPRSGGPAILVLTGADDAQSVRGAFAAGVRGYLRKDAISDELLISAILAVVHGGVFVDARTFALLLSLLA